eukprot:832955-Pyramimonas_sp.AAC.1
MELGESRLRSCARRQASSEWTAARWQDLAFPVCGRASVREVWRPAPCLTSSWSTSRTAQARRVLQTCPR